MNECTCLEAHGDDAASTREPPLESFIRPGSRRKLWITCASLLYMIAEPIMDCLITTNSDALHAVTVAAAGVKQTCLEISGERYKSKSCDASASLTPASSHH